MPNTATKSRKMPARDAQGRFVKAAPAAPQLVPAAVQPAPQATGYTTADLDRAVACALDAAASKRRAVRNAVASWAGVAIAPWVAVVWLVFG